MGIEDTYSSWLTRGNGQMFSIWDPSTYRDAQKESLLGVAISFGIILLAWRGIPYRYGEYIRQDSESTNRHNRGVAVGAKYRMLTFCPVLLPAKILTVLFHESSHAIVGTLCGGRVRFIQIDWWEGGMTEFRDDKQPKIIVLTLLAGYLGSCAIGCSMLFCGFDLMFSKYATVVFLSLATLCFIQCAFNRHKFALKYHDSSVFRHWLAHMWAEVTFRFQKSDKHRQDAVRQREHEYHRIVRAAKKQVDSYDLNDEQKMVSVEMTLGVILFFTFLLVALWSVREAIGLRYFFLGMGTMSALYAVWDIITDGILHGNEESDAHEMAHQLHKNGDLKRWTILYSLIWLFTSLVFVIATLLFAVQHFQETVSEQQIQAKNVFILP